MITDRKASFLLAAFSSELCSSEVGQTAANDPVSVKGVEGRTVQRKLVVRLRPKTSEVRTIPFRWYFSQLF